MLNKLQFLCKIFPDFLTIWNHSKLTKLSSMTPLLLIDTVPIFLILYNLLNRINEEGICILKTVSLLLKFKRKETDNIQINKWAYKTLQVVVKALCMLSSSSHVWFFATPWTVACQAPLSMEFSRQEYWSGLPFPTPGIFPNKGSKLCLLHLHWWWVLYLCAIGNSYKCFETN